MRLNVYILALFPVDKTSNFLNSIRCGNSVLDNFVFYHTPYKFLLRVV